MFNQTELVYNIYYLLDGFDSAPNNYKIKKKLTHIILTQL